MIFSARTENPITQFLLLLSVWIWVVIRVFMVNLQSAALPVVEPLSNILLSYVPIGSLSNQLLYIFMIAFQAVYISFTMQKHSLIERNNWIPSILYLFVISASPENLALSPVIIANLFLILLMERLFESYDSIKGADNVMLAGFYASLCTFFYFPGALFIVSIWIGLIVLRHVDWRYFIVSLIGISIPLLYLGTWFFIKDQLFTEISDYQLIYQKIFTQVKHSKLDEPIMVVLFIISFGISLYYIGSHQQEQLIKIRKRSGIIMVLAITSVIGIFTSYLPITESICFASLLLAISVGVYVSETKNALVSAILFWVLVLFSILSNLSIL